MMPIESKIILDSVQPDGVRLTTLTVTLPKFTLAELNTYRSFSRNSASSRAIPVEKLIQRIFDDPVIPVEWGRNQPGMQAREMLDKEAAEDARACWLLARDEAVHRARRLCALGAHKQIVNRLIEPWLYTTVLITATARPYRHCFAQRCHPDAQPEMRVAAEAMRAAYEASEPRKLKYGGWHLPYTTDADWDALDAMLTAEHGDTSDHHRRLDDVGDLVRKVSVARCARVSYLTQDGKRDLVEDVRLYDRLVEARPMHSSPLEHVAQAIVSRPATVGSASNFEPGWAQLRKMTPGEYTE